MPKHINEERVLSEISIEKDVDGFHPLNIGKLAMKGREPLFLPCTPKVYFDYQKSLPLIVIAFPVIFISEFSLHTVLKIVPKLYLMIWS